MSFQEKHSPLILVHTVEGLVNHYILHSIHYKSICLAIFLIPIPPIH